MNKKIYIAVICAFSLLLTVSTGFLIKHYYDSHKQAKIYDSLAEIVAKTPDGTSEVMNYSGDKTFIPDYQELYLENNVWPVAQTVHFISSGLRCCGRIVFPVTI